MTDLDYEILEKVYKFGDKGISSAELSKSFPNLDLGYVLGELSKREIKKNPNGKVTISISDSAYLDSKEKPSAVTNLGNEYWYYITNRGKEALKNRQFERKQLLAAQKLREHRHKKERLHDALAGGLAGVILGKLFDLVLWLFF